MFWCTALFLPMVVAAATDAPPLRTAASMTRVPMAVGGEYTFTVEIDLDESWSASGAGVPSPLLQIDVPPSIELEGRVLDTYREQANNEFIVTPFERAVEVGATEIGFRLVGEPAPGETIGLSVVAYLADGEGGAEFLRQRIELPVEAGAAADGALWPDRSTWSALDDVLDIGDPLRDVALLRADGSTLRLSDLTGEGPLIITTYRAFW